MDINLTKFSHLTQVSPEQQEIKLRNVAKQFEAVLLTQLTAALNNTESDEDSLFGTDGGADLAKKLFSEQLAIAMADSGGIGLANTILKQFGLEPKAQITNTRFPGKLAEITSNSPRLDQQDAPVVINKSGRINPVSDQWQKSDTAGIISTELEISEDADDAKWRAPFLDPANGIDYTIPANMIGSPAIPTQKIDSNPTQVVKTQDSLYVMPVEGRISSRFGNRFHPIDKTHKFHSGIDIAAPRGTAIEAASDGVVIFAGKRGGYGNMVEIEHNDGRKTRYAHAETISVKEGQQVKAGEKIATVGSSGKATGPHLHFEVRENGAAVNPFEKITNGF